MYGVHGRNRRAVHELGAELHGTIRRVMRQDAAAEPIPRLEHQDPHAAGGEFPRRGETGDAGTDDHYLRPAHKTPRFLHARSRSGATTAILRRADVSGAVRRQARSPRWT